MRPAPGGTTPSDRGRRPPRQHAWKLFFDESLVAPYTMPVFASGGHTTESVPARRHRLACADRARWVIVTSFHVLSAFLTRPSSPAGYSIIRCVADSQRRLSVVGLWVDWK